MVIMEVNKVTEHWKLNRFCKDYGIKMIKVKSPYGTVSPIRRVTLTHETFTDDEILEFWAEYIPPKEPDPPINNFDSKIG